MDKSFSTLLAQNNAQSANNVAHKSKLDASSARTDAEISGSRAQIAEKNRDEWMAHAKTLEQKLIEVTDRSAERKIANEAFKALIRDALTELRKVNPNSPFLDKSNRDNTFEMFAREEQAKIEKKRKENGYKPENITFTELYKHKTP